MASTLARIHSDAAGSPTGHRSRACSTNAVPSRRRMRSAWGRCASVTDCGVIAPCADQAAPPCRRPRMVTARVKN